MMRLNRSPKETPDHGPRKRPPNGIGRGPGLPPAGDRRILAAKGLMMAGVLYAVVVTLHFEDPTALLDWLPVHAIILSALLIGGLVVGCWDHKLDTTHASLGALFALLSGFAALAICQGML